MESEDSRSVSSSSSSPTFIVDRTPSISGVMESPCQEPPSHLRCDQPRKRPPSPELKIQPKRFTIAPTSILQSTSSSSSLAKTSAAVRSLAMTNTHLVHTDSGVIVRSSVVVPDRQFVGGAEAARRAARRAEKRPKRQRKLDPKEGLRPHWNEAKVVAAHKGGEFDPYMLKISQTFPIPTGLPPFEKLFAVLFYSWSPSPSEYLIDEYYNDMHERLRGAAKVRRSSPSSPPAIPLSCVDSKGRPLYSLVSRKLAKKASISPRPLGSTKHKTLKEYYNTQMCRVLDEARGVVVDGIRGMTRLRHEGGEEERGKIGCRWIGFVVIFVS